MKQKYKVILTLKGLVTLTLYGINKTTFSINTKNNTLANNKDCYYEWRFGKIKYTKKGTGNPVLLIHNLTVGSSSYEFHKIVSDLSKTHEVYVLDLLGYGLSDKPNMTYTNFLYVQLVTDFIKHVIGKKTDLIATGDSAPISLLLSHNDPDLINNLVFINPQSLYQLNKIPSKQTRALKLFIDIPILGTFLYNLLASKHFLIESFMNDYFYDYRDITNADINAYSEASHLGQSSNKYSFSSYLCKYTNTTIIHALKKINNNVFIIYGNQVPDVKTSIDNYKYYNMAIEAHGIDKTKLLPHMEQPSKVIELLHDFLG